MAEISKYIRVQSVDEALAAMQQAGDKPYLLAGGTDLLLKLDGISADTITIIDVSEVDQVSGITEAEDGLRLGAAVKLADIVRSRYLTGALQVLADGASRVGSPQIRNLATLGGNLCNAAPSADTAAPLLVLNAAAEIGSPSGKRSLPISEFFTGPGETALRGDEMLTAVFIPVPPSGAVSTYIKLSPRKAMDLAVVSVSALIVRQNGKLEARIALGAVAPTPIRVHEAEKVLEDAAQIDDALIDQVCAITAQASRPISDVRASARYRNEMVEAVTARALKFLFGQLSGS